MIESTSWHSYGKIFNLGHKETEALFDGPVVVEEKIDGSQFSFGCINGELKVRSKGREFDPLAPDGIFQDACTTVLKLHDQGCLRNGWTYRGEVLAKPKHNTLKYQRVPKGNIILFDIAIGHENYLPVDIKVCEAHVLGLECAKCYFSGEVEDPACLAKFLEFQSSLGGPIEGIVIKNYSKFAADGKVLMAKIVREEFRESHQKGWSVANPQSKDVISLLIEQYTTKARWKKAVQHLRDNGDLAGEPRDIPAIMQAAVADFRDECRAEIAEQLLSWAMPQIERKITRGLPEWYREYLASDPA